MDKLVVKGGARLKGRVEISGSKNSALPILAATLLTPEKCVLHNVPDLSDIRFMLEILRQLGATVTFENGTVTTRAEKVISEVPYDLVRKMRASICVLGPMVARCGQATISEPGENLQHEPDVGQIGHIVENTRFPGQKRRRQYRQGRVFGAADFHANLEAGAAFYN